MAGLDAASNFQLNAVTGVTPSTYLEVDGSTPANVISNATTTTVSTAWLKSTAAGTPAALNITNTASAGAAQINLSGDAGFIGTFNVDAAGQVNVRTGPTNNLSMGSGTLGTVTLSSNSGTILVASNSGLIALDTGSGLGDFRLLASGSIQMQRPNLTPAGLLQITTVATGAPQTVSTTAFLTGAAGNLTPVLSFGGASVGITYGSQKGEYSQIGNTVSYAIQINLTSKGSSTGVAVISGFPVAVGASGPAIYNANITLYNSVLTAATLPTGFHSTTQFALESFSPYAAGTAAALVDTNFTNTTILLMQGHYFTA